MWVGRLLEIFTGMSFLFSTLINALLNGLDTALSRSCCRAWTTFAEVFVGAFKPNDHRIDGTNSTTLIMLNVKQAYRILGEPS